MNYQSHLNTSLLQVPYINGSPQNTFVPGCLELAERHGVFVGGDDFKSGQTKFKSVLVDFLVGAGIKPRLREYLLDPTVYLCYIYFTCFPGLS